MASIVRRAAARLYWQIMERAIRFRPQRVAELAEAQLAAQAGGTPPAIVDQQRDPELGKAAPTEEETLALSAVLAAKLAQTAHDIFYQQGFHLLRRHFYLPIPEEADLDYAFAAGNSELPGLDMNDRLALDLMERVCLSYMEEFRTEFPQYASPTGDKRRFYLINGSYMAIDAHIYFALIRHYQPKRIVEIGSGNSTLLALAACLKNAQSDGRVAEITTIDPYPGEIIRSGLPGLSRQIEAKVQDVDLSLFTELEAGDILFIDSSHVLRTGGDVQMEYLEILPRLAPGVLVHIHDVSLPKPYPRVYFQQHLYWNEQYLLQAFLAFNSRFEVLWPGNYMMQKYPDRVCAVFPEFQVMRQHYPQSEPSAFWMRVRMPFPASHGS
jgi:hypothetical protein